MKQYLSDFWSVVRIYDKQTFLSNMINLAPEGSIWTIEGIEDYTIVKQLELYKVPEDELRQQEDRNFKGIRKYLLSKEAKKAVIKLIPDWNLDENLYSQHILWERQKYFIAYHCMQEHFTWVSRKVDESVLDQMQQHFVIRYSAPGRSASIS